MESKDTKRTSGLAAGNDQGGRSAGRQVGVPFGPRGMGLVTPRPIAHDAVLVDGRATLPDGTPRQYSSYCGNYTLDGRKLTTIVDANCDPVRFTAPQVRKVRFDG